MAGHKLPRLLVISVFCNIDDDDDGDDGDDDDDGDGDDCHEGRHDNDIVDGYLDKSTMDAESFAHWFSM